MGITWQAVVLSGGAGTRLWPFSRKQYPKQFLDLTGSGHALLVDTVLRLAPLGEVQVLTLADLKISTESVLERDGIRATVITEPSAKNTAAAVAYATLRAKRAGVQVLGIFPADHEIKQPEEFRRQVARAMERAALGRVVTLGIEPTSPSPAFGYLALGDEIAPGVRAVSRFIEKPSVDRAADLIASGSVVWNAGVFIFSVEAMTQAFAKHMPELWRAMENLATDESNLTEIYAGLESIAIDFGVMERMTDLECVIATDVGWSDLGSWEDVAERRTSEVISVEGDGNAYLGMDVTKKQVVFVGLDDVVAVDTPDALLVLKKGHGQGLREAVKHLDSKASASLISHVFEERPWGRFEVLHDSPHYKVKNLILLPGKRISYQRHKLRTEQWTVVSGRALVTLDGVDTIYEPGQMVRIEQGTKHRLHNAGDDKLTVVEVQFGTYFGEDDIERFDDDFGRK